MKDLYEYSTPELVRGSWVYPFCYYLLFYLKVIKYYAIKREKAETFYLLSQSIGYPQYVCLLNSSKIFVVHNPTILPPP